ncbi:PTS sugar transporter subunit IIC, partial [Paenibacillus sonchi]
TDLLNAIPDVVTRGLQIAGGFIVVVGYAMVINMMSAKYLMPFFFLGFVVAAFTGINLVGFGIVGAVLAVLYIQLNPKYNTKNVAVGEIDEL